MGFFSGFLNKIKYGSVSPKQKMLLGTIGLCEFFLSNLINGAIAMFYTDYIGLENNTTYGNAILIFGIWNMINDPIFAYISDKRKPHRKWGKRRLFMLIGSPIYLFGFLMLVFCQAGWGETFKFIWILVSLFIYDLGMAMYSVNHQALMITLTKDPDERAIISMVRSYIILIPGGIAGLFPSFVFTEGYSYEIVMGLFIIIPVILFVISYYSIWKLEEPLSLYVSVETEGKKLDEIKELDEHEKKIPQSGEFDIIQEGFFSTLKSVFSSSTFVKFCLFVFCGSMMVAGYYEQLNYLMKWVYQIKGTQSVIIAAIGGITINLFYLVAEAMRRKLGSVKTLYITLTCSLIGYLMIFLGNTFVILMIGYGLGCIGFGSFWIMCTIMTGDLVDHDYLKTGKNRQAMISSVLVLVKVPATSVLVWLFTIVLDAYNYDGTLDTQPSEALTGIRIGVGLLRIVVIIVTMLTLAIYPLKGKKYQDMRSKIEEIEVNRKMNSEMLPVNEPVDELVQR